MNKIWINTAENSEKHRNLEPKNLTLNPGFVAYYLRNFKQVISISLDLIIVFVSANVDYSIC